MPGWFKLVLPISFQFGSILISHCSICSIVRPVLFGTKGQKLQHVDDEYGRFGLKRVYSITVVLLQSCDA